MSVSMNVYLLFTAWQGWGWEMLLLIWREWISFIIINVPRDDELSRKKRHFHSEHSSEHEVPEKMERMEGEKKWKQVHSRLSLQLSFQGYLPSLSPTKGTGLREEDQRTEKHQTKHFLVQLGSHNCVHKSNDKMYEEKETSVTKKMRISIWGIKVRFPTKNFLSHL